MGIDPALRSTAWKYNANPPFCPGLHFHTSFRFVNGRAGVCIDHGFPNANEARTFRTILQVLDNVSAGTSNIAGGKLPL